MKTHLFPVLALLASTVCATLVQAAPAPGPKRPGPSAVEAARLKKSPPPNYLAHYLPDDRYKIAGNVWKYVSTDLDTYYHIPSSPNMMRQPANIVIGFASAREAEEAGYVADPTDGTAQRARPVTVPSVVIEAGGTTEGGYVARITQILSAAQRDEAAWGAKLRQSGAGSPTLSPATKAAFAQLVPLIRRYDSQLRAVRAPRKYARFHGLLLASHRQNLAAAIRFSRSLNQGALDLGALNITELMQGQQALMREGQRVGINPQLLR